MLGREIGYAWLGTDERAGSYDGDDKDDDENHHATDHADC